MFIAESGFHYSDVVHPVVFRDFSSVLYCQTEQCRAGGITGHSAVACVGLLSVIHFVHQGVSKWFYGLMIVLNRKFLFKNLKNKFLKQEDPLHENVLCRKV
jgi:hypothetical protein